MGLLSDSVLDRSVSNSERRPSAPLAGALSRLRQHWPFPALQAGTHAGWSRPLRDWLCWATAPDFIATPPAGGTGSAASLDLPMWTLAALQARRMRELATDSAIGPWTPGRLMRVHLQLAPVQPGTFRTRLLRGPAGPGSVQPNQVPALVDEICAFANWRAPDALAQAALVYRQLCLVQPFEQGNAPVAQVVAAAIAARGGHAVEETFPIFALFGRQTHPESGECAAQEPLLLAWHEAHARGVAFAAAVENHLDMLEMRLRQHLQHPGRAARLLEIASARPVLDEALVRATVGAATRSSVDYLRALEAEGWTLLGGAPPQRRRAIANGVWQQVAAIWHAVADDVDVARGAA
jgi:hypothetical protein